jgi:hypothetical protein
MQFVVNQSLTLHGSYEFSCDVSTIIPSSQISFCLSPHSDALKGATPEPCHVCASLRRAEDGMRGKGRLHYGTRADARYDASWDDRYDARGRHYRARADVRCDCAPGTARLIASAPV